MWNTWVLMWRQRDHQSGGGEEGSDSDPPPTYQTLMNEPDFAS